MQRAQQKHAAVATSEVAFNIVGHWPNLLYYGWYRLLDGAHRWSVYKSTGKDSVEAIVKELKGIDPLLYAAKKAIGPRQLTEEEARDTGRRAYIQKFEPQLQKYWKGHWTLKANSGRIHCRSSGRNPAGQRPQNISESSWYPPGQDCKALGDRPEDNS